MSSRVAGLLALLLTTAVLAPIPIQAATWFVDGDCGTAGDGTTQTCGVNGPFTSIRAAIINASLAAGDTIKVKRTVANYVETATTASDTGTQANPITVTRYDADTINPVWQLSGVTGELLNVTGAWWVFDRLDFNGNAGSDDIISINAANVTVKNCVVTNGTDSGISIGGAGDNTTVDNCEIFQVGSAGTSHAIDTGREGDPDAFVITGLRIINNYIHHIGGDGFQAFETTGLCKVATVTGLIDNNRFEKGDRAGRENAIDVKATALANDLLIISNNTITGWDETGTPGRPLVIQHCASNIIVRDNFFDAQGAGNTGAACATTTCAAIHHSASTSTAGTPAQNIQIYRNVMKRGTDGIRVGAFIQDLQISNNTSHSNNRAFLRMESATITGTSWLRNSLTFEETVQNCTGTNSAFTSDFNGWFGTAAQQGSCDDDVDCPNMCDVTDTTGTDPLFVNPGGDNYRLQAGSTAIDAGVDVGLAFTGSAPDLGAEETIVASTSGRPPVVDRPAVFDRPPVVDRPATSTRPGVSP